MMTVLKLLLFVLIIKCKTLNFIKNPFTTTYVHYASNTYGNGELMRYTLFSGKQNIFITNLFAFLALTC